MLKLARSNIHLLPVVECLFLAFVAVVLHFCLVLFSLLFLNVVVVVAIAIIVITFEARAIPETSLLATFSSYFLFGQFFS